MIGAGISDGSRDDGAARTPRRAGVGVRARSGRTAARRSADAARLCVCAAALWSMVASQGCEKGPENDDPAPKSASRSDAEPPSDEPVVVDADLLAQELDAAMAQARHTSAAARERWTEELLRARREGGGDGDVPSAWAVKWAAPSTASDLQGGVEHVWVRPVRWSPQRIEGILLSTPRRAIGAAAGDTVVFPADGLSDWVRDDGVSREGGFTIDVLERWSRRG